MLTALAFSIHGETRRQEAQALAAARRLGGVIEREIDGYVAAMQGLATSPALRDQDWQTFDRQARDLAQLRGDAVSLRREDGQQLINTYVPYGTKLPVSTDPVLRAADHKALATGEAVVSDLYVGAVARRLFVLVVVPVQIGEGRGLLNIAVDPQRLASFLARGLEPGEVAALLDRQSRIIARWPEHQRYFGQPSTVEQRENQAAFEGVWQGRRLDGTPVLVAHSTLSSGWKAALGIPLAQTRRPARNAFLLLGSLTLAAVLLSLVLSYRLAHKLGDEVRGLLPVRRNGGATFKILELREAASQLDAYEKTRYEMYRHAAHMGAIVRSSNDAIFSMDLNGTILSWNAGAETVFGYTAREMLGNSARRLVPDERIAEFDAKLEGAREGRYSRHDTVRVRADGTLVDVSVSATPIVEASGEISSVSIVAFEITERKKTEQQRELLLRELDHRLKNVFAMVTSLVAISARHASSVTQYRDALRRRLYALSAVHDLVRGAGIDATVSLADVANTLAGPNTGFQSQITAEGPDIRLNATGAITFGLIFNELLTNAVKYGSLSRPDGKVRCCWSARDNDLTVSWQEEGGPPVSPPAARGFGTLLIEQSAAQIGGRAEIEWRPDGLLLVLHAKLDRLISDRGASARGL